MSAEDIEAGARWGINVTKQLEETRFGIICLTNDNQTAPWILFEAGALAKTIENTFVVPYLIDLEPADIQRGPLNQFQAKRANKTETWEVICTLNRGLDTPLLETQIERTFGKWWPDLEKSLKELPRDGIKEKGRRPTEDMIEEILEVVRGMNRLSSFGHSGLEIFRLLFRLHPKEHRMIRLYYGLGEKKLTIAEIAAMWGINNSEVRSTIRGALDKLMTIYAPSDKLVTVLDDQINT